VSEQALAASEEGYRVRRELFRSGKATLVEVTDSETELTRARLELVNAHVDLRIAQVELAHVLGRDVGK
jgi:outer membrane protein TolC